MRVFPLKINAPKLLILKEIFRLSMLVTTNKISVEEKWGKKWALLDMYHKEN